ncbi:unnamed protein product [Amoebophrya sp. A120]|nr:unnamed protein product [Amoebophrya sp. A120]|eukprot:GSA120T00018583001.1
MPRNHFDRSLDEYRRSRERQQSRDRRNRFELDRPLNDRPRRSRDRRNHLSRALGRRGRSRSSRERRYETPRSSRDRRRRGSRDRDTRNYRSRDRARNDRRDVGSRYEQRPGAPRVNARPSPPPLPKPPCVRCLLDRECSKESRDVRHERRHQPREQCRDFQNSRCWRGEHCRFWHPVPLDAEKLQQLAEWAAEKSGPSSALTKERLCEIAQQSQRQASRVPSTTLYNSAVESVPPGCRTLEGYLEALFRAAGANAELFNVDTETAELAGRVIAKHWPEFDAVRVTEFRQVVRTLYEQDQRPGAPAFGRLLENAQAMTPKQYSFELTPRENSRTSFLKRCLAISMDKRFAREFNSDDPGRRRDSVMRAAGLLPLHGDCTRWAQFLVGQDPNLPAARRDSMGVKEESAESYLALFEPKPFSTRVDYLQELQRAPKLYPKEFAGDNAEEREQRVRAALRECFECRCCGSSCRYHAPGLAEPLCFPCFEGEFDVELAAIGDAYDRFLREKYEEYSESYPQYESFEALAGGERYYPSERHRNHAGWDTDASAKDILLAGSDINIKAPPESFWEPRRILQWGSTFQRETRFLADLLASHKPLTESELQDEAQACSRGTLRALSRRCAADGDSMQRTLGVFLKRCFDEMKPHTKKMIFLRLLKKHKVTCRNIMKTFTEVFRVLRELHYRRQAARDAGEDPVMEPPHLCEFDRAAFVFDDTLSAQEKVNIACRYYVKKVKRTALGDGEEAESDEASDRRVLIADFLHRLRTAPPPGRAALQRDFFDFGTLYSSPDSRVWILTGGNDGNVGDKNDGGIHVFEALPPSSLAEGARSWFGLPPDATLADVHRLQKLAIEQLWGALGVTAFSQLVTYKGHADPALPHAVGDKIYPTYGVVDSFRDTVDFNRQENKKTGANLAALEVSADPNRQAPTYRALLERVPVARRPSFRKMVGFRQLRTHQNANLSKVVFVDHLGFDGARMRAIEAELIQEIKRVRWEDDPDPGALVAEAQPFVGGSEYWR